MRTFERKMRTFERKMRTFERKMRTFERKSLYNYLIYSVLQNGFFDQYY